MIQISESMNLRKNSFFIINKLQGQNNISYLFTKYKDVILKLISFQIMV